MKSWELLRELFAPKGIKHIAGLVGRSSPLVHKWTEPAGIDASGARNPLDVLALLMVETDAARVAHWVCAVAGGIFVPAAQLPPLRPEERLPACHRLLGELGELLSVMGKVLPSGRLSSAEKEALGRVFAQLQTDMIRLLEPADDRERVEKGRWQIIAEEWRTKISGCRHRLPGGRCGFRAAQRN